MTYEFPISGSGGKGDTWEGIIDVELSEKEYARVVESSKKGFWHMCDDDEISDIYDKIYAQVVDATIENEQDMIDEYREDYELPEDASDREVIESFLDCQDCRISYPSDIDPLMQEDPDEEEEE